MIISQRVFGTVWKIFRVLLSLLNICLILSPLARLTKIFGSITFQNSVTQRSLFRIFETTAAFSSVQLFFISKLLGQHFHRWLNSSDSWLIINPQSIMTTQVPGALLQLRVCQRQRGSALLSSPSSNVRLADRPTNIARMHFLLMVENPLSFLKQIYHVRVIVPLNVRVTEVSEGFFLIPTCK